jgi:hypothetical protein
MTSLDTLTAAAYSTSGTPCVATNPSCVAPDVPPQSDFDAQQAQLNALISDRIFTSDNLESSDPLSATFLIAGATYCTDGTYTPDPTCVSQIDAMELRIRAWPQPLGGVNLQILIGAQQYELIWIELGEKTLAVASDLAQARLALEAIAAAQGATASSAPAQLEGRVELRLTKNGTHDFTLSAAILNAIKVGYTDSLGYAYSYSVGSSNAMVRVEAPKKRITLETNVGEVQYVAPYFSGDPAGPYYGQAMKFFLAGLSGKVVAEEGKSSISFTNLGLGGAQSYAEVGGKRLGWLDVNKDLWRHFDAQLSRDADDVVVLSVTSELDVLLGLSYSTFRELGSTVADAYQDEELRFRLNGAKWPAVKPLPNAWKVLAGRFTASTNRAGFAPVVANAGQCLVPPSVAPPVDAHPLLSMFEVVDCP